MLLPRHNQQNNGLFVPILWPCNLECKLSGLYPNFTPGSPHIRDIEGDASGHHLTALVFVKYGQIKKSFPPQWRMSMLSLKESFLFNKRKVVWIFKTDICTRPPSTIRGRTQNILPLAVTGKSTPCILEGTHTTLWRPREHTQETIQNTHDLHLPLGKFFVPCEFWRLVPVL